MKVSSSPTQNAAQSADLLQAQVDTIPCPFMATMAKEGEFKIAADGYVNLEELKQALARVGVGIGVRTVLVNGAKGTEEDRRKAAGTLVKGMEIEAFDITKLQQSSLMHTGDMKIRRGGFSQARLDKLLSFSSDGQTLTLKDLAAAQKQAVAEDPGFKGHFTGMTEFAALLMVFGTPNAKGEKSLSKDALISLFKDNEFPAGFSVQKSGFASLFAKMAGIAFHQVFTSTGRAAASLDKALVRQSPIDQSGVTGLGRALCPAGMRAPATVSKAEVQAKH